MNKLLVIGANSFVGKYLVEDLQKKYDVVGTYHNKKNPSIKDQVRLDITNIQNVLYVLEKIKPDLIIVLSAISSTKEPKEKIYNINVDGVSNIISGIEELKINPKVIFFSTDQIFDGNKGLYSEKDAPNPINDYGKSKLEGEKVIRNYSNHLILRLSQIIGNKRKGDHNNFVTMFLESKGDLKIFNNVYRTPIYVKDIGSIISELILNDQRGIINLASDSYLSYLEMAQGIENVFHCKKNYDVVECTNESIPKKLGLSNKLLKKISNIKLTDFHDMLIDMKKGDL